PERHTLHRAQTPIRTTTKVTKEDTKVTKGDGMFTRGDTKVTMGDRMVTKGDTKVTTGDTKPTRVGGGGGYGGVAVIEWLLPGEMPVALEGRGRHHPRPFSFW